VVQYARLAFRWAAWLFVACVVVQVFLAGVAVMGDDSFDAHRNFGYTFGLLVLALLVLAVIGRMGRSVISLALALLVLFVLQSVFVALRGSSPYLAALHAVNGLAIFWVSLSMARGTTLWGASAGAST
jgi:heme A synthase